MDNTCQSGEAIFDEEHAAGQKDAKQADDAKKKLTFLIVDSSMGIGKSSALMTYIRFNAAYKDDDYVEALKRTGLYFKCFFLLEFYKIENAKQYLHKG